MFKQYPYINLTDLNLDFILKAIGEMENQVKNFVAINAIKYADPIQWDITKNYEKNTVVIDGNSGVAYISVAPVPVGVALTRPEYWTVIFDLSMFITKGAANFANSYEVNPTTTATMNTNEGEWVVWDSTLFEALTDIHAGDAYVINGNIKRMTVEDFYNILFTALQNEAQTRADEDLRIELALTDLITSKVGIEAQTRSDEDIRIELALTDLITSKVGIEATARQNADNALSNSITTVDGHVGNLANLQTSNKSSAVAAINELRGNATHNTQDQFATIYGKTVAAYGDSWVGNPLYNKWLDEVERATGNTVNRAYGGFIDNTDPNSISQAIVDHPYIADIYIVKGGINDWNKSKNIENVARSIVDIITALKTLNSDCEIYFTTPVSGVYIPNDYSGGTVYFPCDLYRQVIWTICENHRVSVIDGLRIPVNITPDGFHPATSKDMQRYGRAVVRSIIAKGDSRSFENAYRHNLDGDGNRTMYVMKGGRLYVQPFAQNISYTNGKFEQEMLGYTLLGTMNIDNAKAVVENVGGTMSYGYNRMVSNKMTCNLQDGTITGNGLIKLGMYELELFPIAIQHGVI